MKPIGFRGDSLKCIQAFNEDGKDELGYQMELVQKGDSNARTESVPRVGSGVFELKATAKSGEYRALLITKLNDTVYVLHAFPKKTQQIPDRDINLAKARLTALIEELKDAE